MLHWRQIYSDLQLSCFAIYWTQSIPRHLGHMNPRSYSSRPTMCGRNNGAFVSVHSAERAPIYRLFFTSLSPYIPLQISRCHVGPILTTHHLVSDEPLEREWTVIWSVTGNEASCQWGVTIENGEVATVPDPNTIHLLFVLHLSVVVYPLIRRSGNGDMTTRWTHPEGRSIVQIWVTIRDSGSSIYIWNIEWSCMILEI